MTWCGLAEDVAEMFARMEGCGLPTVRDEGGDSRSIGFGVWDPLKGAEHNREYMREYVKRPGYRERLAAWKQSPAGRASAKKYREKRKAMRREVSA